MIFIFTECAKASALALMLRHQHQGRSLRQAVAGPKRQAGSLARKPLNRHRAIP
jgi:hypothetical protein